MKAIKGIGKNSLAYTLSSLSVGERTYVETTYKGYAGLQRRASVPSRLPGAMKEWRFTTQLFTAVSAARADDVRYLVCFERTL